MIVWPGRYILLKLTVVDRSDVPSTLTDCIAERLEETRLTSSTAALVTRALEKMELELVLEGRNETHRREVIEHLEQGGIMWSARDKASGLCRRVY